MLIDIMLRADKEHNIHTTDYTTTVYRVNRAGVSLGNYILNSLIRGKKNILVVLVCM